MTTERKIVNPYRLPQNNPHLALLDAEKKDIEARAYRDLAKTLVIGFSAVIVGSLFIPIVLPDHPLLGWTCAGVLAAGFLKLVRRKEVR